MKTKRLFVRIACILLLTLLSAPLFAVNSSALMQNAEDMNWARTADLQEVKNKLKDLQEYLLPLDRHDMFFYQVINVNGGGSNQGNANGYTNRFSYSITTEVATGGGSHLPVTRTRVDLNLPELPHYDGHDRNVFYYCEYYSNSWDNVSDYADVENSERITTIGGYPAKGYARVSTYKGKTVLYESYIYVNLQTLFPWIQEGAKGGIVLFHVNSNSEADSIAEAQRLIEIIKNWQPTISEPVVIAAETDPEVLKNLGIKKGGTNVVVDTPAKEEAGEDSGTVIPDIIVVGTLGAGAAIAGAAIASGGSEEKKRKRKAYKMYIQKDFGDAIRRGGDKPVIIRARMAEVDENGVEHDRNDLTGNIGVSADGMTVHGVALVGRYCEAMVSVPEYNQNDTASIAFTYLGEGGSFTNNVIFRIVDGPQLKFVDERDGTLYHENCGIDAIPGDGFTYTERFAVVDAPVAPKLSDISAVNTGEFDVEFALTDQPALYKMTVKNNTKPDSEHDIFAKPVDKNFEIHVNVEGEKEPVKGYVTVKLYPEGITVSSTMEGKKNDVKYVRVQAYEKEYVGDLDRKWQVSEIKFTLACKGKDKAIIDPKKAEYKFDKLKGAGGKGTAAAKEQAIADKYDYKESWGYWNGKFTYTFEPQDMLWEPDNGTFFMVLLPVTCEYDGQTYKDEIPLRLRGKDPDPMEEWNKEYAKTRERIEKFSLPSQKDYNLEQLEKIAAKEPRISTWELRLMAKDVVRTYMKYWTEQNEKDKWNAAALDWTVWGLEWVKWIGDCAFSYVAAAYTGPMEAIISPAKDVLVSALGEVGVNIVWGTKFNVENLEVVAALKNAGDNFVSGWASEGAANVLKANPANIKMAAGIMGAYFAYACLNNYLEHMAKTGESDFYGAIMGAFKDLTVTAIKAAASILFGKWLESENFKNKIGPKLSAFMKKYFGEKCRINLTDQTFSYRIEANAGGTKRWMDIDAEIIKSGIAEKYFTELCGAGAAFIHDNIETAEKALFWFNPAGEIIFSFSINLLAGNVDDESAKSIMHLCDINLSKALKNTSGELFNWMYELFFSSLPVATDVMEIPKDPPLPPAKN